MRLYSILDKKAGQYGGVLMAVNDGMMARTLKEQVSNGHVLTRFPEDFDLYYLGEFNDSAGSIDAVSPAVFVCSISVVLSDKER